MQQYHCIIPLDQEGRSCLYVRSSTPLASQCSQSRCNTDRPAGSASLSFHSPTGLRGYLPRRNTEWNHAKHRRRAAMGAGCEISMHRKVIQQVKQVLLKWNNCTAREASRSMINALLHFRVTYRTGGQNLQGERRSAEQREPPSSCPTHSFALCLSSSGLPLRI